MIKRYLDLSSIQKRTLLLLGARQTGKSTLVAQLFPTAKYYDCLQGEIFRRFSARPELLRQELGEDSNIIIIDEVQRLPELLNEVQSLLRERPQLRFVLTGSSARKLKGVSANLLGGRAWRYDLFPLVYPETGPQLLMERINKGGLPHVLSSQDWKEDLESYIGLYLREEIAAEGIKRGVENFSRFLEVAALTNAEQINFTSLASDIGCSPRLVKEYYQILEDTLIGCQLPAYQKTIKRKPVATAKFFLFDIGVSNCLLKRSEIKKGSELYGKALEHLIYLELKAYLSYLRKKDSLTYWRSTSQFEVDFLVGDEVAIEVKAKELTSSKDYKGLCALREEVKLKRLIVVCNEPVKRKAENGVEIFPVEVFLDELWKGELI